MSEQPEAGSGRPDHTAERVIFELAISAAGIGTFDWDLASDRLHWDDRLLEMFGLDPSDRFQPMSAFFERLHPADRERVRALLQEAIDGRGAYEAEYRVVLPGGAIRWIAARGQVQGGGDGEPLRLIGAAHDTTARRDGEARIARVMDSMSTAFFALDQQWRFSYVNAEAERVLGRSAGALIGDVIWELFPAALGSDFETFYRHAVASGEPVAFDAYYPEPLNAWYEVRAWPHPEGLAVYFLDITERRRAHERAERAISRAGLLGRVTEELAATVDAEDAMDALARLVVPALADWAMVTLIDDAKQPGRRHGLNETRAWHADPAQRPVAQRYAELRLDALVDDSIVAGAIESSELQLVPPDATERYAPLIQAGEARQLLRQLAPYSIAVYPLRGREHTIGMLTLCNGAARGAFSDEDIELGRDVAARAGIVLDRARLYRQQREVAESLQRSMLTEPPNVEQLQIAVRYAPAAQAHQVGGDWYDAFLQPDGSVVLAIGDVMGHDLDAAAAMGQARTLLRAIAALGEAGPAAVLTDVERVMHTLRVTTTATAVMARLEPIGECPEAVALRWSNAGHPPPLTIDPDGAATVLADGPPDVLLGVLSGAPRREHVVELALPATVLLYTDGLVESRTQSLEVGVERLRALLCEMADVDLEKLCDQLLAEMLPERPEDDVALVAVRLRAARSAPG
ncbi:MAG: SpoIIE family protein phosphatase [Actinomycetota bacterium]|nr:SpoIIE family protein phosphatase [Actinomycetota bacterium]